MPLRLKGGEGVFLRAQVCACAISSLCMQIRSEDGCRDRGWEEWGRQWGVGVEGYVQEKGRVREEVGWGEEEKDGAMTGQQAPCL